MSGLQGKNLSTAFPANASQDEPVWSSQVSDVVEPEVVQNKHVPVARSGAAKGIGVVQRRALGEKSVEVSSNVRVDRFRVLGET